MNACIFYYCNAVNLFVLATGGLLIADSFVFVLVMHFSVSLLTAINGGSWFLLNHIAEAAVKKCSYKKVFLKYAANLLENAHASSHVGMGVLL